ncbi:3'-5' exonuclease [Azotobacter chroococcum]|nr:3'-5' exonuclease [Azotobacter chroococcum]
MAVFIPPLGACLARLTAGQRQVARALQDSLADDCLVWCGLPDGGEQRQPDFIVLHPEHGLLFLEVRDWTAGSLKRMSRATCTLETAEGRRELAHPLALGRQFAVQALQELLRSPALRRGEGSDAGRLACPLGWGLVFSDIARAQVEQGIPPEARERLLPERQVLYRDDLREAAAESFGQRLWRMAGPGFPCRLTQAQVERIRWHLFPELRIGADGLPAPDGTRLMDLQQERLARSLGEGQQVIHGAAGSGKTLVLAYRCLALARTLDKPVLVVCFNSALAARLRRFAEARGLGARVHVHHFHDWCEQQLETWQVEVQEGEDEYYWGPVDAVIGAVERGRIPRDQYGALLIDEGHDFEPEWLALLARMVDPRTGSLLLCYDDAQAIYKKRSAQGFSLAGVGIQTRGRPGVLRLDYRNTREILAFACCLVKEHLPEGKGDIPLVEPQAAGGAGPLPVVRRFERPAGEIEHAARCLRQWHAEGVAWKDMAVLYPGGGAGQAMGEALAELGVPHVWLDGGEAGDATDRVAIMTIHRSKGLEFPRVVLLDASFVAPGEEADSSLPERMRLLYVGITRARQQLLVGFHRSNAVARALSGGELGRYAH